MKRRSSKSRKIDIFPNGLTHGFGPKKVHCSNFFFLRNIDQENVFYDILERKNAWLGYKNKKSQKSKNWHFSKEVNPWFWSKNDHFFNFFFLRIIDQENVFYDIFERINAFLGQKNKKFKESRNWHFSKQVNSWFWSKNLHFSFFFTYYIPGKCILWYPRMLKRLFRL